MLFAVIIVRPCTEAEILSLKDLEVNMEAQGMTMRKGGVLLFNDN